MSTPTRRTVFRDGNAKPLGGYPHAHIAGGFVYVSGTSSRQADDTIVGAEPGPDGVPVLDIRAQTRAVIENIRLVLAQAGCTLADLVTVTTYLTSMDDFAGYNEVYTSVFDADTGPARTTVAVTALPRPQLLIEMQAVAVLPAASD